MFSGWLTLRFMRPLCSDRSFEKRNHSNRSPKTSDLLIGRNMSGLVDSGLNSSRTCCFHRISACLCSIHSGRPNHRAASGPPAQPPGVTQAGLGRCFWSQYLDSQHIYNRTLIAEFHALSFTFPTVLILFSSARFCLSSLITDIFRNHPVHFSPPRSHDFLLPASLEWAFYCLRLLTCLFSPSPKGAGVLSSAGWIASCFSPSPALHISFIWGSGTLHRLQKDLRFWPSNVYS